jgi:hypothetical protein
MRSGSCVVEETASRCLVSSGGDEGETGTIRGRRRAKDMCCVRTLMDGCQNVRGTIDDPGGADGLEGQSTNDHDPCEKHGCE